MKYFRITFFIFIFSLLNAFAHAASMNIAMTEKYPEKNKKLVAREFKLQKRMARLENYLNKAEEDGGGNYKVWKVCYFISAFIFFTAIAILGLLLFFEFFINSIFGGQLKFIPINPLIILATVIFGLAALVCFIVYKDKEKASYESGDSTKPQNRVTEKFKKIKPI